jgi:hypothetical protein
MRLRCFLLILLLLPLTVFAAGPAKGLLLQPLKDAKGAVEPGLVVQYMASVRTPGAVNLTALGRQFPDVPGSQVMPFDPEAAMCWAYLQLKEGRGDAEYRFLVAKNLLAAVPAHPLREDLLALHCLNARDYSRQPSGAKAGPPLALCRQYLSDYPRGSHRDEIEWLICRLDTEPLEYEGDLPLLESSIGRFERFLWQHTRTANRSEIQLHLAALNRQAYESLSGALAEKKSQVVGFTDGKGKQVNYSAKEAQAFLERARTIYRELAAGADAQTRATARLALFNIENGRRMTSAPMDW